MKRFPPALALAASVLAMSWGGPLVRYADAPALVVSFWRLTLSVLLIALIVALRGNVRLRLRQLDRRDWMLAVSAGIFLAAHFWSWIASLGLTTISSSVVLVSLQPVWVALLSALFLAERAQRRQWLGIALAVCGAMLIGWGDWNSGTRPLQGDGLALAGGLFISAYYIIGRGLRQRLDLWIYVLVVYGVAAVTLAGAALVVEGDALIPARSSDWLVFAGLAIGPMLVGHTGVNYALRYVPSYVANLVALGEPVGATLLAWWLPGIREQPGALALAGAACVLAGIVLGARHVQEQAQTQAQPS